MATKQPCPKCGSYKTNSSRSAWKHLLLLGLATSWLFGIGLIFVVLAPLVGIVSHFLPEKIKCQGCGYEYHA